MIDRRRFLHVGSAASLGALLPGWDGLAKEARPDSNRFEWPTKDLTFSFLQSEGGLHQGTLVPFGLSMTPDLVRSSEVVVALQCSGEDSPDQGLKSGAGQPGLRLKFMEKRARVRPR